MFNRNNLCCVNVDSPTEFCVTGMHNHFFVSIYLMFFFNAAEWSLQTCFLSILTLIGNVGMQPVP